MKIFGYYSKNRKYLLPLVMMAAMIFIFQGIRIPTISNPLEPKLSSSQKTEPLSSAVIKTLLQSSQCKVEKTAQFLDLFNNEHQFQNPAVYISAPQLESHLFTSAVISTKSARAPPA